MYFSAKLDTMKISPRQLNRSTNFRIGNIPAWNRQILQYSKKNSKYKNTVKVVNSKYSKKLFFSPRLYRRFL